MTAVGVWAWDTFGDKIVGWASDEAKEQLQRFSWRKAQEDYRKKLIHLHDWVRVLGDTKPTPLGNIFTDVYIHDKPSAYRRFAIEELKENSKLIDREHERLNGVDLVKSEQGHRLFILGKPGAGKTTFLKYITVQAAQGNIDRIPIFVSLKEWSDSGKELFDFLVSRFEVCNFPDPQQPFIEHILEEGKAIVLFDGLDEVVKEEGQRTEVAAQLRDFSDRYHESQCLITCRVAASEYTFGQFTYVEVANFNDEQIETFVQRWFRDEEGKRDLFLREVKKNEHRGIYEMARIPLLLSMLCLGFGDTMEFPQRRVEIYEEAIEALLKKWDTSRGIKRDDIYGNLSLGRKRQLFARIAAKTFFKGDYFLEQDDLARQITDYLCNLPAADRNQEHDIDGVAILYSIEAQHGIFVERTHKVHSFAHLSFQEYFAAKYTVENASELVKQILQPQYIVDSRWREVLLNTASLLSKADDFFDQFLKANEKIIADEPEIKELLVWAEQRANEVDTPYQPAAVRAYYLAPAPALALALDLALDLALALALELELDLALALELELELELDLALELELKIDTVLPIALQIVQAIARSSDKKRYKLQGEDVRLSSFFQEVVETTQDIPDLHEALTHIQWPSLQDTSERWEECANNLRQVMITHRNIGHRWNLNRQQVSKVNNYLKANNLLVECLNLAYVSDRQGILERLLLPPAGGRV